MRIFRFVLTGGVLLLAAAVVAPAIAQSGADASNLDSKTNVLLTFRMGTLEHGQQNIKKSYQLVVAEGTLGSKLLSGERIPFPASSADGDQTFVYQNIGFSTEVWVRLIDKKTIRLEANIEDSRVVPGEGGAPPSVETRQLTVNVILAEGVPLEVCRAEGITDDKGFVEIVATVLK